MTMIALPNAAFRRSLQPTDARNNSFLTVLHRASHHTASVNAPQKTAKRDALLSFIFKRRHSSEIFAGKTAKASDERGRYGTSREFK
jgi:hypothetical protein